MLLFFFDAVMGREHCKSLISEGKISCAKCFVKEKLGSVTAVQTLSLRVDSSLTGKHKG